ncbi:MAG TPA: HEAT repeat domain-containing protein, partial [Polyangiales bacterium]
MLADVWKLWAICALAQVGTSLASADALPLKKSLQLGRPARAIEVELSAGETLDLRLGGTTHRLQARAARSAEIEQVAVADDAAVAVVRVAAENGDWVALLGGRAGTELLAVDRGVLWGDPGERRALMLHTPAKADGGAGAHELSLGVVHEALQRCGDQEPWLTQRRVLDPKTLRLVAAPAPSPQAAGTPLQAQPEAGTSPRLALLGAASSSAIDPLTQGVRVPHALVDGRTDNGVPLAPGELLLLRWAAPGLPITRLAFQLQGRSAPTQLRVSLEGARFDISLPKPSGSLDRFSVSLPPDTNSSCVSIELLGTAGVQLTELSAFSKVDEPDGLDRLIGDLVQDGPRGAIAAELLPQLGEPAARSVAARFAELSARGQRRALKTLAPQLALAEARARAGEAARSQDEALSLAAFEVLRRGKEPGRLVLRELAKTPDRAGDRAALLLAQPGAQDMEGLLLALSAPMGADRPALRRALVGVARRDPEGLRTQGRGWLGTQPALSARIGLAYAAAQADVDDLATELLEGALEATSFEDRFRVCLAAAEAGPSPTLDTWLARQATEASEWMQRRAAYDALLARGSDQAARLVAQLAKDPYPRVRASAARALAQARETAPLVELARTDAWALVRAEAARGLSGLPGTRATLETLVIDRSRHVRAASIDGLTAQRAVGAWPLVSQRLTATDEWPLVQAAAVRFAAELCVAPAHAALADTARRALRPDASDDDRQLGLEAIRALHDLGGPAQEDAR